MVEISFEENQSEIQVSEASEIGKARRWGSELCRRLQFDELHAGRVAIVITEIASNLVKHAREGVLVLRALGEGPPRGIQILALDKGPGIYSVADSLRDGHSTFGSPGNGFGAMQRLSSHFDIYSQVGQGTALVAEIWSEGAGPEQRNPFDAGAVSLIYPDESVCGDGWAIRQERDRCQVLVVDGLGHGIGAADAAREAIASFLAAPRATPTELLQLIHGALQKTRGAAVAIAELDRKKHTLTYAGIGNITGVLHSSEGRKNLVSHNGTVGFNARKFVPFLYSWSEEPLLIMHSDGLDTHWNLANYPGLAAHAPSIIAGVLVRDHRRLRDDVTVVALKPLN